MARIEIGSLLIGFFANPEGLGRVGEDGELLTMEGIFFGGSARLLGEQALANLCAIGWSFVVTGAIVLALKSTIGVRVSEAVEEVGLDQSEHAESAYATGVLSSVTGN